MTDSLTALAKLSKHRGRLKLLLRLAHFTVERTLSRNLPTFKREVSITSMAEGVRS